MSLAVSTDLAEEERRARKLAAAKKKLKTFRATRTSEASTSSLHSNTPSASSSRSIPISQSSRSPRLPSAPLPLMSDRGANISASHSRGDSKGKGKGKASDVEVQMMKDKVINGLSGSGAMGPGHERRESGAQASGRHRRQQSSMSFAPAIPIYQRSELAGKHDADDSGRGSTSRRGLGLDGGLGGFKFGLPIPRDIITTPATPSLDPHELDPFSGPPHPPIQDNEEDTSMVKQRLSTFSFGSKSPSPALGPRSPASSPGRRSIQRGTPGLLPSVALRSHDLNFSPFLGDSTSTGSVSAPGGLDRLGSTPSRPPSLLFTKASPLMTSPSAPHRLSLSLAGSDSPSPSTPPTPARKRHSHTRSNSISLSNLKIGAARPVSLGIPASPSFPSSPSSPTSPDESGRPSSSTPLNGTRLKFEPSEAEMAKEESRRRALEKLTGSSPIVPQTETYEERQAEISLPDLEDDTSSTASSSRPLSSAWGSGSGFTFGRPSSLTLPMPSPTGGTVRTATPAMTASPFPVWPAEDAPPMSFDRWSAGFKDEGFGAGFGMGFGAELQQKRGSFTGSLAVLQEEEETEEEAEAEGEFAVDGQRDQDGSEVLSASPDTESPVLPTDSQLNTMDTPEPVLVANPSSRLKELKLLSSVSATTSTSKSTSTPSSQFALPKSAGSSGSRTFTRQAPVSPTKGYGTIGRGRPRPLSGIVTNIASANAIASSPGPASSPLTGSIVTPKTARPIGRRRLSGSSRRSSISYKKDKDASTSASAAGMESMSLSLSGSSISSRWSLGSKVLVASPTLGMASPPLASPVAGGANWAHVPRAGNRPCPRPKSLVGLGIVNAGSNRVLSEVLEKDEGLDTTSRPLANYNDEEKPEPTVDPEVERDGWGSAPVTDRPFTFRSFGSMSMSIDLSSEAGTGEAGRRSLDSEGPGAGRWRDSLLELELERDALREDVTGWRERCKALEEKLEGEKKESGALRERIRKLSDRLLTVSSVPPQSPSRSLAGPESRLVREMRDQLFSLTSAMERERREKDEAFRRIAELEQQLLSSRACSIDQAQAEETEASSAQWSFSPYLAESPVEASSLPSNSVPKYAPYAFSPSTPIVTPATPLTFSPSPSTRPAAPYVQDRQTETTGTGNTDINDFRMRAWGFPAVPLLASANKGYNKRDSFFGLSKVPTPQQEERDEEEVFDSEIGGVDLPPFVLPSSASAVALPSDLFKHAAMQVPPAPELLRAVSDSAVPLSWASGHWHEDVADYEAECAPRSSTQMTKSASASTFSDTAFALISGILPGRGSPTKSTAVLSRQIQDDVEVSEGQSLGISSNMAGHVLAPLRGGLDMTLACRCCVGEVLEL